MSHVNEKQAAPRGRCGRGLSLSSSLVVGGGGSGGGAGASAPSSAAGGNPKPAAPLRAEAEVSAERNLGRRRLRGGAPAARWPPICEGVERSWAGGALPRGRWRVPTAEPRKSRGMVEGFAKRAGSRTHCHTVKSVRPLDVV